MSTDHPPFDDLDLSNLLDEEVPDHIAARLEADPAAQARLDQLRAVRDLVAGTEVPPLSGDQVDDLIAAALAAGDHTGPAAVDDRALADVVPVPRSRRTGGVPPWVVAAVVVVLVGLGLSLVWMGRDGGDAGDNMAFEEIGASIAVEDSAADGDGAGGADNRLYESDAAASAGAAELAPEATDAEDGAATTTAPSGAPDGAPTLVNLGEFPDADALREHLREGFPEVGENGPLPETGVDDDLTAAFRCLGKVDGLFEPTGEPTDVGLAIVAGDPAVVYDLPYRTDEGRDTTIVIAVDEVSCIPVLSFQR